MLQIKNVKKIYNTKGEQVTALNGVSIDFPENGMVFLLGKSGSGKSTLLNIAGGLDAPDEGEIIVRGKSSAQFSSGDYDSYRNTFVGFIFQEYNILNEFSVGENVALALELQDKRKDRAAIERILEQVDLGGMYDRAPNTLSGGQKQRVAIARALVKNPEIIMADEPTGALDSTTGKQVLDTLKKLSKDKLVMVVSHDRDFAAQYADRIIELKDGSVVSDLSRTEGGEMVKSNLCIVSENTVSVSCGATLTDGEAEQIVRFLKGKKSAFVISSEQQLIPERKKAETGGGFEPTRQTPPKEYETSDARFIDSHLPFRHALKMGLSSVFAKPLRLAVTLVLTMVAFIVFGVFSTLVTFDENEMAAETLSSSDFGAAVLKKNGLINMRRFVYLPGVGETGETIDYTVSISTGLYGCYISEEEFLETNRLFPEMQFVPVFNLNDPLNFARYNQRGRSNHFYAPFQNFQGFVPVSKTEGNRAFALVAGTAPSAADEIAVSQYVYESFLQFGCVNRTTNEIEAIGSYDDLIGKTIELYINVRSVYLKITGIFDPQEEFTEFLDLKTGQAQKQYLTLDLRKEALAEVFASSMSSLCVVGDGFYHDYAYLDMDRTTVESHVNNIIKDADGKTSYQFVSCDYTEAPDAPYQFLYASLNGARSAKCSEFFHDVVRREGDCQWSTTYPFLSEITKSESLLNKIFPIIGSVAGILAVFAALLLFNFISASINARKKEIGILRAVGARGIDIFKIFFIEALCLTFACFVLGNLGSIAACAIVNPIIIAKGIFAFNFFVFGWKNMLMLLAIAVVTSSLATVIPVVITAKKKPVEAIRSI